MNARLLPLIAALATFVWSGCAAYDEAEMAQFRQRGVPPPLLNKLQRGQPLDPGEIIALKRYQVSDREIVRHLDKEGVDYVVTRSDVLRLRGARLSPLVIDTLLKESDRFAERQAYPNYDVYGEPGYGPYYDDWFGFGYGF